MKKASDLYETLFSHEHKRDERSEGYPMHKVLDFNDSKVNDIYDWILNEYNFKQGDKVLDAGCGVGYGSLKMVKFSGVHVMGISVSSSEIVRASQNAITKNAIDDAEFIVSTFESCPDLQFNYIVAVESLKHSENIQLSLNSLYTKLTKGGQLIIVEDVYDEGTIGSLGSMLMSDWSLIDLFSEKDFTNKITEFNYTDLTQFKPKKSFIVLSVKLFFLSVLRYIPLKRVSSVAKIFRGGIILDLLYSLKRMRYGVFSITKI